MANRDRTPRLFIIEDSPADAQLLQQALEEVGWPCKIHAAQDGDEALAGLSALSDLEARPDLILLDLSLPRQSGLEVLRLIKAHPTFGYLPVIVLSGSESEEDIVGAYEQHAACFVLKPFDMDGYVALARAMAGFWLSNIVRLPRRQLAGRA